jgi:hypothetical protein
MKKKKQQKGANSKFKAKINHESVAFAQDRHLTVEPQPVNLNGIRQSFSGLLNRTAAYFRQK